MLQQTVACSCTCRDWQRQCMQFLLAQVTKYDLSNVTRGRRTMQASLASYVKNQTAFSPLEELSQGSQLEEAQVQIPRAA